MSSVIDPTEYVIRTRFDLGDGRVPGLNRISRQLGGIDNRISGIGRRIRAGIGGAFMAIAGGVGIGAATRGIIGLHTEVQNTEMGIASLVSAMSGQSMAASVDIARASVRGLRQDAAAGVGELRDYAQGFQQIMGPALQGGADLEQVRKLTRMALTAGFALRGQEGLKLAPMDVVQSLTAGVGERTTPIVNQALRAIGKTNEEFNKLSKPERLRVLEEAFGRFGDAADAMGQTWDAQTATLLDNVKELGRTLTRPLFERWTEQLSNANEWLTKNRDVLNDMAENGGQRLLHVYDQLLKKGPLLLGGVGAAGAGGNLAGAGMGLATAGRAAGVTGKVALRGGVIGAVASAVLLAITGTITAGSIGDHGVAKNFRQTITDFSTALDELQTTFGELATAFRPVWDLFKLFSRSMTAMADITLRAGVGIIRFFSALGRQIAGFAEVVGHVYEGVKLGAGGDFAGAKGQFMAAGGLAWRNQLLFQQDLKHLFDRGKPTAFAPGTDPFYGPEQGEDRPFGGTTNNFNGPVTVTVQAERLDDPNTVASSFEAVLRKLMEHPRTGRGSRLKPKPV